MFRIRINVPALAAIGFCISFVLPTSADFSAGMDAYQRADFATALKEWQPLADRGMVEAQFNLGLLHQHGKGVDSDLSAAHAWYLRAAEQGYARAQYRVAEMYERGEGVRKDDIRALYWYRLAARQKYDDAKKRRKAVAKRMTPEQIAYAEMLLRQRKRDPVVAD